MPDPRLFAEPTEAKRRPVASRIPDAFIVRHEDAPAEDDSTLTWKEAGEWACVLSIGAAIAFGLHYWRFGTAEGEPRRGALLIMFVTICAFRGKEINWRGRLRMVAVMSTVMALIGFHLHFVVGGHLEPEWCVVLFAAMIVVVWVLADAASMVRRHRLRHQDLGNESPSQ